MPTEALTRQAKLKVRCDFAIFCEYAIGWWSLKLLLVLILYRMDVRCWFCHAWPLPDAFLDVLIKR